MGYVASDIGSEIQIHAPKVKFINNEGSGSIFIKNVDGAAQLFFENEEGETQVTGNKLQPNDKPMRLF